MISSASSQMQPLSAIGSYVKLATGGFALASGLLNLFLSMNVAWMVTAMMPFLGRTRRLPVCRARVGVPGGDRVGGVVRP